MAYCNQLTLLPFKGLNKLASHLRNKPTGRHFLVNWATWVGSTGRNEMQIGWSPTDLWRHIDFTRWRPWRCKSTSGFSFDHVWHL